MYPDDEDSDSDGDRTELVDSIPYPCRRYGYVSDVHLHTESDHSERAADI